MLTPLIPLRLLWPGEWRHKLPSNSYTNSGLSDPVCLSELSWSRLIRAPHSTLAEVKRLAWSFLPSRISLSALWRIRAALSKSRSNMCWSSLLPLANNSAITPLLAMSLATGCATTQASQPTAVEYWCSAAGALLENANGLFLWRPFCLL